MKTLIQKTLLLTVATISIFFGTDITIVNAEDCLKDPIFEQNWNAKVTTGARLRDIPCMTTSKVITTLPVNEIIKVTAQTDGYYKIQRKDGTEGWVGQWLITATDEIFTPSTSQNPPASETPKERLYDIIGHKYETAIRWMDENGIISGYPDGSFQPNGDINRAEFVKIMTMTYQKADPTFDFENIKNQYNTACFTDITPGEWYTPYVCYAKENGIIEGYSDGHFRPQGKVAKVEALKIAMNTFHIPVQDPANINDLDDVDLYAWYAPFLEAAVNNNLVEEKTGNFYPGKPMLRSEASNLVYLTYFLQQQQNAPAIQ